MVSQKILLHFGSNVGIVINDHQTDWDLHLSRMLFAYRTALHAATGFSSFHIVLSNSPTLLVDVMLGTFPHQQPKDVPAYVSDLHKSLNAAYATVQSHIQSAHEHNKQRYDAAKSYLPYTVGDQVWLHVPAIKTGGVGLRSFLHSCVDLTQFWTNLVQPTTA